MNALDENVTLAIMRIIKKNKRSKCNFFLPNAWMTGTDRILQLAVTNAPHFFSNCVNTHPTGEQPSVTRTLSMETNDANRLMWYFLDIILH